MIGTWLKRSAERQKSWNPWLGCSCDKTIEATSREHCTVTNWIRWSRRNFIVLLWCDKENIYPNKFCFFVFFLSKPNQMLSLDCFPERHVILIMWNIPPSVLVSIFCAVNIQILKVGRVGASVDIKIKWPLPNKIFFFAKHPRNFAGWCCWCQPTSNRFLVVHSSSSIVQAPKSQKILKRFEQMLFTPWIIQYEFVTVAKMWKPRLWQLCLLKSVSGFWAPFHYPTGNHFIFFLF